MRIVTDYLDHSAELFPDKTAVADQYRTVTFGVLKEEALHIASYIICLLNKSPRPRDRQKSRMPSSALKKQY